MRAIVREFPCYSRGGPRPKSAGIRNRGAQLLRSARDSIGQCALFKEVDIDPNREMPKANRRFSKRTNCSSDEKHPCLTSRAESSRKLRTSRRVLEPQQIESQESALQLAALRQHSQKCHAAGRRCAGITSRLRVTRARVRPAHCRLGDNRSSR